MSSLKGFARQRDKNEPLIIAVLESIGCSVQRLSEKGVPDILAARRGVLVLIEVKAPPTGRRGGGAGKLTKDQEVFIAAWKSKVHVVMTPEDAVIAAGCHPVTSTGDAGIWTYCPICPGIGATCHAYELHERGTYPRTIT